MYEGGRLNGGNPNITREVLPKEQLDFYNDQGYLVIPGLLTEEDMAAPKQAINQKVSYIADELFQAGLVTDKLEHRPFHKRLAELFANLTDQDFLKFGRGWRDRFPGYFEMMSNPKILDAVESLIGGEIFVNPAYRTRSRC